MPLGRLGPERPPARGLESPERHPRPFHACWGAAGPGPPEGTGEDLSPPTTPWGHQSLGWLSSSWIPTALLSPGVARVARRSASGSPTLLPARRVGAASLMRPAGRDLRAPWLPPILGVPRAGHCAAAAAATGTQRAGLPGVSMEPDPGPSHSQNLPSGFPAEPGAPSRNPSPLRTQESRPRARTPDPQGRHPILARPQVCPQPRSAAPRPLRPRLPLRGPVRPSPGRAHSPSRPLAMVVTEVEAQSLATHGFSVPRGR